MHYRIIQPFLKGAARRYVFGISVCLLLTTGCTDKSSLTLTLPEEKNAAVAALEPRADAADTQEESPAGTEASVGETVPLISVHVCGGVRREGVYRLAQDARVADAVTAAGGFTSEADTTALNLAAFLVDGCRVRIPLTGEASQAGTEDLPVITVGSGNVPVDGLVVLEGEGAYGGKVNINTATAAELCTLHGVGEKRAADIIRYREENGAFSRIEDIMKVGGIKQNLFERIKDRIRV